MNDNSAPPGGWEPPEPPWVKRADGIVEKMTVQVDRFVRVSRRGFLIWMLGGMTGYWVGFLTNEIFKWLAGTR